LIKRNIVIVDDILKRKGQGMRRYRSQSKGHRGERAKRGFQAGGQRQGGRDEAPAGISIMVFPLPEQDG